MNVGIVGCGVISDRYAGNAEAFDSFELVACADLDVEAAAILADAHGLAALSVEDLLADPAIDVVLNLTPPAAHGAVLRQALEAGSTSTRRNRSRRPWPKQWSWLPMPGGADSAWAARRTSSSVRRIRRRAG